ncbi:MAG: hypothetical protein HQ445_09050 [Polaromonas sp.]|nr:hypothetical protein [Polaromonas sp.]
MTRVSTNTKTGPIPVTTISDNSCPVICPLKKKGCYPEYGPLAMHWRAVSAGTRGGTLDELCVKIKALPKRQLWRWAQAGDLPGDGTLIDFAALAQLVEANTGRRGFGYTHYDPFIAHNAMAIRYANERGFIINLSANNLAHADQLAALGIAPVATVLPIEWSPERTPEGRHVAECPANVRDDMMCANCEICAVPMHKSIIGFRAHGSGAKKAQIVFFARTPKLIESHEPTPIEA